MTERGGQTRGVLLRTAAKLFAERGPENVSLNEITRAAGQRNASALQYHFGGREGLLRAILQPRLAAVDLRRSAILDSLENENAIDVRGLARALVEPLAWESRRTTSAGGRPVLDASAAQQALRDMQL